MAKLESYAGNCEKISKISIYLLTFFLPIFFLPWTSDILNFNKQALLVCLVFIAFFAWIAKIIFLKKVNLVFSWAYIPLVILFLFFAVSAIFSLYPSASFWGLPLSITDNLVTIFSFLLLIFLVINIFRKEEEIYFIFTLFLFSGIIAGFFLILQLYRLFILPFDFSKISSFNTIGNVYQAAIFLSLILPISLVLAIKKRKLIFWLLFFILLGEIVLIDSNIAWISILFGIFALIAVGFFSFKEEVNNGELIGALMLVSVLSIFFLFFPLRFSGFPSLPIHVSPNFSSEVGILKEVYSSPKDIFLGSGPGTFAFDYSKYRSPILNNTVFWGSRFSTGNSEILDWFLTKGVFGGLSLIFLFISIIYLSAKKFFNEKDYFDLRVGLLASASSLAAVFFLSPFNISLWFAFWLILGGLLFYTSRGREINLNIHPRRNWILFFFVLAVTFVVVFLFIFQTQKYLAEVNYAKGIKFSQRKDINQAINHIEKASVLNSSVDTYWRDLSQMYLFEANLISQDKNIKPERKKLIVHQLIAQGIKSVNKAISCSKFNVANWNVSGFFYRELIGVPGAGEISLNSYRKAIELEPASPFSYTEIARVYILMAQDFRKKKNEKAAKESLSLALKNLEKSIKLKPDYPPANYLLSVAYDQIGEREKAILKLEKAKKILSQNVGISFQLGMLYWRDEKLDKAQEEFKHVLEVDPNYSNARYMLGLVYDKKGEKYKAKKEFSEIHQSNPDNKEIKKILENIDKGLPALKDIVSSQPPISSQTPPEIKNPS